MKSTRLLLCLLLLSAGLTGCLPNDNSSSFSIATATTHIGNTQFPSTPILTPTNNAPLATATLSSPIVFPAANEAYLLLQAYLKNDPPCQLPCWGGVTPGVSTVSEAEKEFMKLKIISSPDFTYFGQSGDAWYVGSLHIFYPLLNTQVDISPGFVAGASNRTVVNIQIDTQSLPTQNSTGEYFGDQEYNTLLSAYSMPRIFTTYGLPNLVYVRADAYPSPLFLIRLLYLDLGIFISYTMPTEEQGNKLLFCPSKSLITLDLTPQDIGENYQDFFQQFGDGEWTTLQSTHHKPIEDALGMTIEEFSQAIISSPESCFESPIEIWPEP